MARSVQSTRLVEYGVQDLSSGNYRTYGVWSTGLVEWGVYHLGRLEYFFCCYY